MTDTQVTLVTRDGARIQFPCAPADHVLDAAEDAGYFLPSMCHDGTCGLCHAHVSSGDYKLEVHAAALDANPGAVLLCKCKPQGDVTIDVPYNQSQILRQKVPVRDAIIQSLQPAWEGAVALSLQLIGNAEYGTAVEFSPGQYMELTIPGTDIRRAYSLANLPNWEGRLDFLIRLQPGGAFSTWLGQTAKVGDTLSVRGPCGTFVLDEVSPRPRWFVGGGCGMAPILSMLRHLGEFQDSQPAHLVFGANRPNEILASEEFDTLRASLPQLELTLSVMDTGSSDWCGFTGTAPQAIEAQLADFPEAVDIYACGPPKMLEAVEAMVGRRGKGDRLIAERL